ncbi:MAG TPA: hypothetical protein VKR58_06125 [Aquella sp.]|nr:hypothetical protein [Aquella sp.]
MKPLQELINNYVLKNLKLEDNKTKKKFEKAVTFEVNFDYEEGAQYSEYTRDSGYAYLSASGYDAENTYLGDFKIDNIMYRSLQNFLKELFELEDEN